MRETINPQLKFGQVDISQIKFDLKSRDDMPKILRGLQHIYITDEVREPIFKLLEEQVSPNTSKNNGRPGMELWSILVLGVIRLDLNCDYDRLHELSNNHRVLRQMLGHSDFADETYYNLQTLKDNISLLTPELLEQINQIIVTGGHALVKKKANEVLLGRCDSFVVETNVHYPTDTNLLFDAMRKVIQQTAILCESNDLSDFRQYAYNIRQLKNSMRTAQKTRRRNVTTPSIIAENNLVKAHQEYINISNLQLLRVTTLLEQIENIKTLSVSDVTLTKIIRGYIVHAERQVDQIERRVINGEIIPHNEKVFSIFEPHTEWISKGKAGVPVEFGLRVCIMEDQHQFILHHKVMEKETDDKVTVSMVKNSQTKFPKLKGVSFDKGFHSKDNQETLKDILDLVALPRKGKLSIASKVIENTEEFKHARKKHSAVESAINALEVHGLDVCKDHGIHGFKRYVALAVVTRNIHRIGDILHKQEQTIFNRRKTKMSQVADAISQQQAA